MAKKLWVLNVVSPAAGQLVVLRDGTALPAEIGPGLTTPVELLLASIGTCFALSCWAAFVSRGLERVGFEVRVIGRKAAQLPSRLSNINLEVIFDVGLPYAEARAVIASAERLCTVTNTMTFEPPCTIEVDVANRGGRNAAAT